MPWNLLLGGGSEELTSLRFWVEVEGVLSAMFKECSGLSTEIDVTTYQEGGLNDYEHKLPGRIKYGNITLRKGIANIADLWTWFQMFATGLVQRKNISIIINDTEGRETVRWNLLEAYPVRWQGPDLNAEDNTVAIETLEVAFHGLVISRVR